MRTQILIYVHTYIEFNYVHTYTVVLVVLLRTHVQKLAHFTMCVYSHGRPNYSASLVELSTSTPRYSSSIPRLSAETFLEFQDRANTSVQNISVDGCIPNPNQKSHEINVLLWLYLTPASHADLEGSYWPAPSEKSSPNCTAPLFFF